MKLRVKYGTSVHTFAGFTGDSLFSELYDGVRRQFSILSSQQFHFMSGFPPKVLNAKSDCRLSEFIKGNCAITVVRDTSDASTPPSLPNSTTVTAGRSTTGRAMPVATHAAASNSLSSFLQGHSAERKVLRKGRLASKTRPKALSSAYHALNPKKRARRGNPFGNLSATAKRTSIASSKQTAQPTAPLTPLQKQQARIRRVAKKGRRIAKEIVRAKLSDSLGKSDGTREMRGQVGLLQLMAQNALQSGAHREIAQSRYKSALAQDFVLRELETRRVSDGLRVQMVVRFRNGPRALREESMNIIHDDMLRSIITHVHNSGGAARENLRMFKMAEFSPRVFWSLVRWLRFHVNAQLAASCESAVTQSHENEENSKTADAASTDERRAESDPNLATAETETNKDEDTAAESSELDDDDTMCAICGTNANPEQTLLCDGCDKEYHMYCLTPRLITIPEGDFFGPCCKDLSSSKSLRADLKFPRTAWMTAFENAQKLLLPDLDWTFLSGRSRDAHGKGEK